MLTLFLSILLLAASWPDELAQGNFHLDHGHYREAIASYNAALQLSGSPYQRAETLYRLGVANGRLADFAEAEKCYRQALALFRTQGDSALYALTLAGLGETYRVQYRPEEALALERRDLAALDRLGLSQGPEAAAVLNITGAILFEQHRYKEAEHDLREASKILEKTAGPTHPDFAMSLNNLGSVEIAQGRLSEAETLLSSALRIRQARFGPDHPLIASTLLSLSSVYSAQRRYEEADRTCRDSIAMMRHFLPPNHPDLINAQRALALITHDSGNSAAAIGILEEVVHGASTEHPPTGREYVQLLGLYARYLDTSGQKAKARRIQAQAADLAREAARPTQANATVTLDELAPDNQRR
jgi:tetratricopeptide (TPR) repeat protein